MLFNKPFDIELNLHVLTNLLNVNVLMSSMSWGENSKIQKPVRRVITQLIKTKLNMKINRIKVFQKSKLIKF